MDVNWRKQGKALIEPGLPAILRITPHAAVSSDPLVGRAVGISVAMPTYRD